MPDRTREPATLAGLLLLVALACVMFVFWSALGVMALDVEPGSFELFYGLSLYVAQAWVIPIVVFAFLMPLLPRLLIGKFAGGVTLALCAVLVLSPINLLLLGTASSGVPGAQSVIIVVMAFLGWAILTTSKPEPPLNQ